MKKWEFVPLYNTNKKEKQSLMMGGEFAEFLKSMKDGTDYSLTTINSNKRVKTVSYFQKKDGKLYLTSVNPNSLWWNRRMKLKNLKNKIKMTLQERIQNDMKTSMLNKDVEKLSLLRVIKGEINREAKELSDDRIISIIRKMKENAEMMNNQDEIKILNEYLPTMLGEKQTETLINGIISKGGYSGMKDMGKVMTELKVYSGQIDGKIASGIVRKMLN